MSSLNCALRGFLKTRDSVLGFAPECPKSERIIGTINRSYGPIQLSVHNIDPKIAIDHFHSPNSIFQMQYANGIRKVAFFVGFVGAFLVISNCTDRSVRAQPHELLTAESKPASPASASPAGDSTLPPVGVPTNGGVVLSPAVLHQNLSVASQLLSSGQFADSQIVLQSILREQPDCARAEFLLGVAMMKQKQYGQARPHLEASLAKEQDFSGRKQVDHFLGWTCYYLGDLESAKRYFQSHVGAVPMADDSYYGLGVIAIDEDRISDAQVALERAMELIGTTPARKQDRAKVLARLGDVDLRRDKIAEALELYEHSLELWPDHYEVWGKIARVYDSVNRPVDADQARANQQSAMQRTRRTFIPESVP